MSRPDQTPLEMRLLIVAEMLDQAVRELGAAMVEARAAATPAAKKPTRTAIGTTKDRTQPGEATR